MFSLKCKLPAIDPIVTALMSHNPTERTCATKSDAQVILASST